MYQNQSQLNLPQPGQRIAISSQQKYIGKTKDKFEQVGIALKLDTCEVFIVESDGIQHAFKPEVTNLYIGGDINEGRSPLFADTRNMCEQHFLELLDNGQFRVRSVQNTYLCIENDRLIWKYNPNNFECVWNITVLNGNPSKVQTSILPLGHTIYLYNDYGIIGKKRGIFETLEMSNELGYWEEFMPVRSKNENKIGLKQVASGYYIGHHAHDNETVCLAPCF
jgi:hypothetical protein